MGARARRRVKRRGPRVRIGRFHPAWATVRTVACTLSITLGVAFILYVTSNNFDRNEWQAIGSTLGAVGGIVAGVNKWLKPDRSA